MKSWLDVLRLLNIILSKMMDNEEKWYEQYRNWYISCMRDIAKIIDVDPDDLPNYK